MDLPTFPKPVPAFMAQSKPLHWRCAYTLYSWFKFSLRMYGSHKYRDDHASTYRKGPVVAAVLRTDHRAGGKATETIREEVPDGSGRGSINGNGFGQIQDEFWRYSKQNVQHLNVQFAKKRGIRNHRMMSGSCQMELYGWPSVRWWVRRGEQDGWGRIRSIGTWLWWVC